MDKSLILTTEKQKCFSGAWKIRCLPLYQSAIDHRVFQPECRQGPGQELLLFEEEEPDFEEALELADEDVPEEEPPPEEPVAVVEDAGVGELVPLSEEEDWDWLSFLDSEPLASVGVPLFSDLL